MCVRRQRGDARQRRPLQRRAAGGVLHHRHPSCRARGRPHDRLRRRRPSRVGARDQSINQRRRQHRRSPDKNHNNRPPRSWERRSEHHRGTLARLWTSAGHEMTALGHLGGDAADADVVLLAVPGCPMTDRLRKGPVGLDFAKQCEPVADFVGDGGQCRQLPGGELIDDR